MEDIEHRPISIPKATVDLLLKQDEPAGLMSLYLFYYYTAIWQKTNQPRATTAYVAEGLKISVMRVRRYKSVLLELGLIKEVIVRSKDNKHIAHHFINVTFYKSYPTRFAKGTKRNRVEKGKGNAYSTNKRNAYSNNKKKLLVTAQNRDGLISSKKRSFSDKCSQKLEKVIRRKRKICKKVDQAKWSAQFSRFRSTTKIKKSRITKILNWYIDHFGEKFVPQAYSAKGFCDKFLHIEDAYERFMEHVNGGGALEIEEEHEYADPVYGDGPVDMDDDE